MRPFEIDFDPALIDADGIADANDSSGATLALDGVLTAAGVFTSADGLGRQIAILDTATVDQTGAVFTITGTDANDVVITDAVVGPDSGQTVTSVKRFKTVTAIDITDGVACSTVDVGTNQVAESKAYIINGGGTTRAGCGVNVTGTINYDIQVTFSDVSTAQAVSDAGYVPITAFDGKSADLAAQLVVGSKAVKVVSNTFTDGAELRVSVSAR